MRKSTRSIVVVLGLLVVVVPGGFAFGQVKEPAAAASPRTAFGSPAPDTITYVGNSGYLIWVGGQKVLIDAAFDGYPNRYTLPAAVQDLLLNGRAPFDAIDLVLATHSHKDHFSADMVSRLLRASPKAVFVGPDDAAGALGGFGDRVRALRVGEGERKAIEVNGIRVEAVYLSHGTPPPGQKPIMNLGYLVTVGHRRFFHTGDIAVPAASPAYVRGLGLPDARIDYGLVPHFLLASADMVAYVRGVIAPRVIIATHLQYTDPPDEPGIRAHCPEAVILKPEMASWAIK